MGRKKKEEQPDPCAGCEAKNCKTCEHKVHKALKLNDADTLHRIVNTEILEGDLPYNREIYLTHARFFMTRTAESMIQVGKLLLVMREKETHGDFLQIITGELGLTRTTAYRFMDTAIKLERHPRLETSHFGKFGQVAAILEAPEEDLQELEDKGILAGNTIEELQRMSVKEMRDMIKKLKTETDKIVKKEVKALETEKKSLVKEVERLKAFEPKGIDEDTLAKLTSLDETLEEADKLLRSIVFKEDDLSDDTFGKVSGICKRIRDRFDLFEENFSNLRDEEN